MQSEDVEAASTWYFTVLGLPSTHTLRCSSLLGWVRQQLPDTPPATAMGKLAWRHHPELLRACSGCMDHLIVPVLVHRELGYLT